MITPFSAPARPNASVLDSTGTDSISTEMVDLEMDTATVDAELEIAQELYMFIEADTVQYLKKASASGYGQLLFEFNLPVKEFRVKPISVGLPQNWRFKEFLLNRDSIKLWLRNVELDSLALLVQADSGKIDTVDLELIKIDTTLSEGLSVVKESKRKLVDDSKMKVKFSRSGRSPKPGYPMNLTTNHPVSTLSTDSITVLQDSIPIYFQMRLADSTLRRFELVYDQIPEKRYEIEILSNAFTDFNGLSNSDTITTSYKSMLPDELGNAELILTLPDSMSVVIQVLDEAGKIVHEEQLQSSGTVILMAMAPGKYSVKAIFDKNENGKWDTGRYHRKIQPEQAVFYPSKIEIRPNWDLETEWDLSKWKH
jgi:hypothetical protein